MYMGKVQNSAITIKFAQKIVEAFSLSDGILCNSFYQFDKDILNELYKKSLLKRNFPIRFITPLISQTNECQDINTTERIQIWLNTQQNISTKSSFIIYVAIGSIARLQPKLLVEIAHALHNYSVIWSLKTSLQTYLPSTFVENPNHLLLNRHGQNHIVWPIFADQFMNGYRLEKELRISRSMKNLTDIDQHRIFHRNEVENYFKDIFDHEKIYFDNAQQIQQIIRNAQHIDAQQSFQDILQIIDFQRIKHLNQHHDL